MCRRSSVDYGRTGSTRASMDAVRSPVGSAPKPGSLGTSMGSLPKSGSLARPGLEEVNNAGSGKIGATGWWHSGDNGEQPRAWRSKACKLRVRAASAADGLVTQGLERGPDLHCTAAAACTTDLPHHAAH